MINGGNPDHILSSEKNFIQAVKIISAEKDSVQAVKIVSAIHNILLYLFFRKLWKLILFLDFMSRLKRRKLPNGRERLAVNRGAENM
jgi:hypothetical protein